MTFYAREALEYTQGFDVTYSRRLPGGLVVPGQCPKILERGLEGKYLDNYSADLMVFGEQRIYLIEHPEPFSPLACLLD